MAKVTGRDGNYRGKHFLRLLVRARIQTVENYFQKAVRDFMESKFKLDFDPAMASGEPGKRVRNYSHQVAIGEDLEGDALLRRQEEIENTCSVYCTYSEVATKRQEALDRADDVMSLIKSGEYLNTPMADFSAMVDDIVGDMPVIESGCKQ